jgi:hypothetical protein
VLAAGCNLDRPEMDDAIVPTALAATATQSPGHELFRMFEAEKQNAAMVELPAPF